jgi:hypothetical protein
VELISSSPGLITISSIRKLKLFLNERNSGLESHFFAQMVLALLNMHQHFSLLCFPFSATFPTSNFIFLIGSLAPFGNAFPLLRHFYASLTCEHLRRFRRLRHQLINLNLPL